MSTSQNRRKRKERRDDLFTSNQDNFERRRIPDRRCGGFEISTIFLSDDAYASFTQEYALETSINDSFDIFKDSTK